MTSIDPLDQFCRSISIFGLHVNILMQAMNCLVSEDIWNTKKKNYVRSPCVSHSLQSTQYSNSIRFFFIAIVITMDMKTISTKSCVANLVCQFEAFLGLSFGTHLASMSIWYWMHWYCAISGVAIRMQATTTRALEHNRTLFDFLLLSSMNTFTSFSPKFYCLPHRLCCGFIVVNTNFYANQNESTSQRHWPIVYYVKLKLWNYCRK